tara:strand:- start:349 stop:1197 length:849 start_codon:yes stop_codon:yes gene_type:complete
MATNTEFILTRYLYNKTEVKHSLFLSLLDHNIDESLFWGFELYYSGFEEEAFVFLQKIFEFVYEEVNNGLSEYVEQTIINWNQKNEPIYFANLVATLSTRKYDLTKFCKLYLKVSGIQNTTERKNFRISLKESDIEKFNNYSDTPQRMTLKTKCIYKIRKEANKLFNIDLPEYEKIKNNYHCHWLYFASKSPVWSERIAQFHGKLNENKKEIEFQNDDYLESFYVLYNYEPDEQSIDTQTKCIGIENEIQLSIKDFCSKYNFILKTKKFALSKNSFSSVEQK